MKSTERLKRCGQVLKNKLVNEEIICKSVKEHFEKKGINDGKKINKRRMVRA